MPYRWTDTGSERVLTLWPHQSMTSEGFAWFMGSTATLLAVPLLAVLGSPVLWVLLAFLMAAFWGVWRAIMANRAQRSYHEALTLGREQVRLAHVPRRGTTLLWVANPHWVRIRLRNDGPVEKYLTLTGGGREVELGAFLTPEERQALYEDLNRALRA